MGKRATGGRFAAKLLSAEELMARILFGKPRLKTFSIRFILYQFRSGEDFGTQTVTSQIVTSVVRLCPIASAVPRRLPFGLKR